MAVPVYTAHNAADTMDQLLKGLGLPVRFKLASKLLLTPEALCAVQDAKEKILELGIQELFGLAGIQILFSGPKKETYDKYCKLDPTLPEREARKKILLAHTERAKRYGQSHKHILLDRTKIGEWTEKYNGSGLYDFIQAPFNGRTDESQLQTDFYMGFISIAMILARKGKVETFVCGADQARVFMAYEIHALMYNEDITHINGVPAERFRKIYYSGDKDAVYKTYRKIAAAEARLSRKRMKTDKNRKRMLAKKDYRAQRKFYWEERKETILEAKRGAFIGALRGVLAGKSDGPAAAPV